MNISLPAALLVLAANAWADAPLQNRLVGAAQHSEAAAASGSLEGMKSGAGLAMGESKGVVAVQQSTDADYKASLINAQASQPSAATKPPPEPKQPGIISRTGTALKGVGEKLTPYIPHALAGGIGMGLGAVAAKAAGFGLLGGILTGGAIGLAAYMLHKKGQTHTAIGVASFGVAGLALGGPVGGLVGAVVGGLGAWLLGKFFS